MPEAEHGATPANGAGQAPEAEAALRRYAGPGSDKQAQALAEARTAAGPGSEAPLAARAGQAPEPEAARSKAGTDCSRQT